jgi:hypothetical protein
MGPLQVINANLGRYGYSDKGILFLALNSSYSIPNSVDLSLYS